MPEEKVERKGFVIDYKWLVSLLLPFIGWGISIEVRMSSKLPERIANLETALTPVLIEYGVRQELAKRGEKNASPIIDGDNETRTTKPENASLLEESKRKIYTQFPNAMKR